MRVNAGFHAFVRGRVQMVGFRFFTQRLAQRLGIHGWVRNMPDGSVEVEAVGDSGAIDEFLRELHAGPPAADVKSVDITWFDVAPEHHGFHVRH
jgi:acylphosphatase